MDRKTVKRLARKLTIFYFKQAAIQEKLEILQTEEKERKKEEKRKKKREKEGRSVGNSAGGVPNFLLFINKKFVQIFDA